MTTSPGPVYFISYGGGIHHTAYIGGPPEHREWKPGDPVIHPILGANVRVEAYVTIDAGMKSATYVGARTWLQKHVHIGHDAHVGEDCELAPHTTICGHAHIGDGVRIGVNACVLPYRKVGPGAHIGAGAIVARNVPPGAIVRCAPAKNYREDGTEFTTYLPTDSYPGAVNPFVDDEVLKQAHETEKEWADA